MNYTVAIPPILLSAPCYICIQNEMSLLHYKRRLHLLQKRHSQMPKITTLLKPYPLATKLK